MVVRVDHKTDRKFRHLADLRQKLSGWRNIFKRIHHQDAIAANDKSRIAAGLAAVSAHGGIDAVCQLFHCEIWVVGAQCQRRKEYERTHDCSESEFHAGDGNTNREPA